MELRQRDECRGSTADAVEQRHHLRHRGHLHAPRSDGPERASDRHAHDDLPVADDRLLGEGDRDCDQHPDRADPVSAPRGRRVG